MQIGNFDLHFIDAGRYRLDGGAMFGVVPKTLWQRTNPADDKNRIDMSLNTVLLVGDGRIILIDTGCGDKFNEKFAKIYGIDNREHSLLKSLGAQNIQPEDVTEVILTHLHFDHVGGATYYDKDGNLKLTFPNATHYIQKNQLEWAKLGFEKDRASYLKENIEPLEKSGKLKILEGAQELFPDIEIRISDGHTIAQQLVLVKSENQTFLYAADLIPMSAHISVPWVMAYDLAPIQTITEKKAILKEAVAGNWIVFFEHDPLTHAGYIGETEKGFFLKNAAIL